jgi:hypothetical protein
MNVTPRTVEFDPEEYEQRGELRIAKKMSAL